jgi:fibronectin type 3 domain-containing protein
MAVLSAAVLFSGCAYIGDPKPPALDIPGRITDLRAAQFGGKILVEFTVPPLTTEGLGLTGLEAAQLHVAAGSSAKDYTVSATGPGAVHYDFPAQEWAGKQVTLTVRATGPKAKMSEPSNAFQLPVGQPVPPPADIRAIVVPEAIRLTWSSPSAHFWIFRTANDAPMTKLAESDKPEYVDNAIDYGSDYKYFIQAMDTPLRQSELSKAVSITPRDTFPPATPVGLAGVPGVNSIELVWERSEEGDFQGYHVYRSTDGGAFERIAGPIPAPTYSDRAVEIGRKYSYSVSAIDITGNESGRSALVEVTAQ